MGVVVVGENASVTGESFGGACGALEHTQAHPPDNQNLKGHNPLVGREGSDGKWDKSRASDIVPSLTPPPHTVPQCSKVGCPTLVNT